MAEVIFDLKIVKAGLLVRDRFGNILDARSNVVLITNADQNIIVDTGLGMEKEEILTGLSTLGLSVDDICIVINTHSHIDHCGNNSLFKKSRFIGHGTEFGSSASKKGIDLIDDDTELEQGITLLETPGHTSGSISVLLKCMINDRVRKTAITGDALPIMDNFIKWVPPGINIDPKLALASMRRIVDNADVIVPGHDKPFEIIDKNQRIAGYLGGF